MSGDKSIDPLQRLERKVRVKRASEAISRLAPSQMAFWPDEQRAIANELARSSLFSATEARKDRRFMQQEKLFVLGEGQVWYQGMELRTDDEDVFTTLAHAARDMGAGDMRIRITSSQICKHLGWRQSDFYYEKIWKSIVRLKGGTLVVASTRLDKARRCAEIEQKIEHGDSVSEEEMLRLDELLNGGANEDSSATSDEADSASASTSETTGRVPGLMLNLIKDVPYFDAAKIDPETGIPKGNVEYEILLDRNMVTLFARPFITLMDFQARSALSATGKRLQSYYLSHKKPHPILLRKLEKMCGLHYKSLAALKHYMQEQHEALVSVGVIKSFLFEQAVTAKDWKVRVER